MVNAPPTIQMENLGNSVEDCWNVIGIRGDHSCNKLAQHTHCYNCPVFANAAVNLLDGDITSEDRWEWREAYSQRKTLIEKQTQAMVVFRVGEEWLGLDSQVCSEFIEEKPVHSLPNRHQDTILGLVNIRGQLHICVSFADLLGIEAKAQAIPENKKVYARLIVLQSDENSFVTPADELIGLVRYNPSELCDPPTTVNRSAVTYTRGLLPWRGTQIGYLDHELLFYTFNQKLT